MSAISSSPVPGSKGCPNALWAILSMWSGSLSKATSRPSGFATCSPPVLPTAVRCSLLPFVTATPPVYQPDDSSLVQTVQNEVLRFHNVVPFGFNAKGFDPLHSLRIAAAKRINYLYQKENSGKVFTSMPADEALLNELWRQLSSAEKTAALLAANATNTFIRSFGTLADHLSDDALVESFAAVDHARRNMACLLAGYSAMPADQRARLNSALQSADSSEREEATIQSKYSKCMLFVDKDITPYALLPENLKQYYRAIVRNIHVVC